MIPRQRPRRLSIAPLFASCLLLLRVATPSAAQQTAPRHVLLYRISDADSVAYLLGSVHVARPGLYPLGESIERAFAESQRLVVEVDVRTVGQEAVVRFFAERGMLPEGRTLRGELGEELARRLDAKLAALGLPAGSLDPFRPWVAYAMLPSLDLLVLGYDPSQGVDLHFLGRAGEREIVELETVEQQLDLLTGFTDEEQLALLADYLGSVDTMAEELESLFDAWRAGDVGALQAILATDLAGSEIGRRTEQLILRRRDAAMAEQIEALLAGPGTSFIVIGAAHTVGEGSVPDLLARRGYAVTTLRD